MSQKADSNGNLVGSYGIEDLKETWFPEDKKKHKRRDRLRRLDYELLWDITEMQVKVHVRALFPGQKDPRPTQLAKEHRIAEHEKVFIGESRSKALIRDIEIVAAADLEVRSDSADDYENAIGRGRLTTIGGPARHQLPDEQASNYQDSARAQPSPTAALTGARLQVGWHNINDSVSVCPIHILYRRRT